MAESKITQRELFGQEATGPPKKCTWCGETKPLSAFYAFKRSKDGKAGHCKQCQDARRAKNREEPARQWTNLNALVHCGKCDLWKARNGFYPNGDGLVGYCRQCWRQRCTANYAANREAVGAATKKARKNLRAEMLAAYGGVCKCCGENEPVFLTLDHVNGGGKQHQSASGGTRAIMRELKRRGWPQDEFRLLCANCNCGRYRNGGECPHVAPTDRFKPRPVDVKEPEPTHKTCSRCKEEYPLAHFYVLGKHRTIVCKTCRNVERKVLRHAKAAGNYFPDQPCGVGCIQHCGKCDLFKVATDFHATQGWCKSCMKVYSEVNREHLNAKAREREHELIWLVQQAYGAKCNCCGETEPFFLTIDHIHGGGTKERKEAGANTSLAKRVLRLGCPKDTFQLLCFSCNMAKHICGACPHQAATH